jgi:hypothetical protein
MLLEAYLSSNPDHPWNTHFNDQLQKALEDRAIPIWMPYQPQPGVEAITQADETLYQIQHSRKLLVVVINMTYVQGIEIGLATALRKPIILLTQTDIEPPALPKGLAGTIFNVENLDEQFNKLVYPLAQHILM